MTDSTLHPKMDPRERPATSPHTPLYANRAYWHAFTASTRDDVAHAADVLADLTGQCCRHAFQLSQWGEMLVTHEEATAFEVEPLEIAEMIGFVAALGASFADTREQLQHVGPNVGAGEPGAAA